MKQLNTCFYTFSVYIIYTVQDKRVSNYIYHILNQTYEGEFLIATYDFETNKENYNKLLETKKQTYFNLHKVAKLIVNHEFQRTKFLS